MKIKKYKIPVIKSTTVYHEVDAESMADAIEIVEGEEEVIDYERLFYDNVHILDTSPIVVKKLTPTYLTYSEWVSRYSPLINPRKVTYEHQSQLSRYGYAVGEAESDIIEAEAEIIYSTDNYHVWTIFNFPTFNRKALYSWYYPSTFKIKESPTAKVEGYIVTAIPHKGEGSIEVSISN